MMFWVFLCWTVRNPPYSMFWDGSCITKGVMIMLRYFVTYTKIQEWHLPWVKCFTISDSSFFFQHPKQTNSKAGHNSNEKSRQETRNNDVPI